MMQSAPSLNRRSLTLRKSCFVATSLLAIACSSDSADPRQASAGSGGTSATGGATASGGATTAGGNVGSGGASAKGGSTGGGAVGTGGGTATAGATASGGKGGVRPGNGGAGTTTGGNPGSASGGATAATGGSGGGSATTAGCGKTTWPMTNDQSGSTPYTLPINGMDREYYVNVPAAYNASQPARVVFAWHWRGGNARNITGGGGFGGAYYGLKTQIADAIFIAAEGLSENGQTGWANTGGQDITFLKGMLDWLDANYCIDKTRIFSTGFSYGGIMSDTIACQMGSTFRAIGPIAGSFFGGGRSCLEQPVAGILIHGSADTTLEISGGAAARDYLIETNHCTTTTQASDPSPCVTYDGCDAGYPVVWCEHTGGHNVPSFASAAIGKFFLQF
jgi:polyhydroxybutyrate depolymerase